MSRVIRDDIEIEIHDRLPVLPLRDVVIFPNMVFPLLVGKESSLRAIQEAVILDKLIFLAVQKDLLRDEPEKEDLYRIGVVARVLQVLKLPNGFVKMLVEGLIRGRITRFYPKSDFFEAHIDVLPESSEASPETQAILRHVISLFKEYIHLNRNIPDEVLLSLDHLKSTQQIADFISAHIQSEVRIKQELLERAHVYDQLLELAQLLQSEKELLEIERDIEDKVRSRIQKSQRNFYLQEQIRVLQEELGDEVEINDEFKGLAEKIRKSGMSGEAREKAYEELNKLKKTPPMSPEATVIRNYLDWLLAVPWKTRTRDNLNLEVAKKVLDEDHYGLQKPKERILEHLAVLKLVKKMKGPILCLVGPPGVGKTSLGKSIARAMGRNFVRVSLGGVRDEAEIRGHRRTYIGSMPGRIIQSMKKAKSINPVFLLDEVDKMSVDFRGDPSAALLEVLDPEQNKNFNDHYLEVDYDLSQVLFITTANVRHEIPEPLQDRMEIIDLPGYLEHEKLEIARGFLIPKQLRGHGLKSKNLEFTRSALVKIIRQYTREAGVRNLERMISSICRKIARELVTDGKRKSKVIITGRNLQRYLGVPLYPEKSIRKEKVVGVAHGLAWTSFGGDILKVEVTLMKGKGNLTLTGNLGEVMKESAMAALSYARTNAKTFGLDEEFYDNLEIHIHVPEGAIPKDGPSAGITMATALISALSNKPVNQEVAMTGEITLRGDVLGIGGLNEKMLAAQRAGIKTVLIPAENEKDLKELPTAVKRGLKIILINQIEQALKVALIEG